MKLSKKDRKLVEASIEHWEIDIWPLLETAIDFDCPYVGGSGKYRGDTWLYKGDTWVRIPCYSKHCPLCREYGNKDCVGCPLNRAGFRCVDDFSPWEKFRDTNTIRQAKICYKKMVDIMKSLLEG